MNKPPQERKTPYKFSDNIAVNVRAKTGWPNEIRFERRYEGESQYSHALTLHGREGVEELRDYLNEWLKYDEEDNNE